MSAPPPNNPDIPQPSKYPDINAGTSSYPPAQGHTAPDGPPPVGYPASGYPSGPPAHGYPPGPPPTGYPQQPPGYPTAAPVYGGPQHPTQYWVPPVPVPGMPVKPPVAQPLPGQEVIHYQVVEPEVGCGKCDTLSMTGWIAVVCLALILGCICLPLAFFAFIPCCMETCHEKFQRPVYGYPPSPPPV